MLRGAHGWRQESCLKNQPQSDHTRFLRQTVHSAFLRRTIIPVRPAFDVDCLLRKRLPVNVPVRIYSFDICCPVQGNHFAPSCRTFAVSERSSEDQSWPPDYTALNLLRQTMTKLPSPKTPSRHRQGPAQAANIIILPIPLSHVYKH